MVKEIYARVTRWIIGPALSLDKRRTAATYKQLSDALANIDVLRDCISRRN